LTTAFGIPVADDQNNLTAEPPGPVLMQDVHLLEKLAHFDRERIPVHNTTVDEIRKR
jgi:catalase